jgi:hypothetical protein
MNSLQTLGNRLSGVYDLKDRGFSLQNRFNRFEEEEFLIKSKEKRRLRLFFEGPVYSNLLDGKSIF